MRFSSDDERFGVLISASSGAADPRFFRFQLILRGTVIGDVDDSLVYHAVQQLGRLPHADGHRLSASVGDPSELLRIALTDEDVHDQLIRSWSESLDRWILVAFIVGDLAVWVGQAVDLSGNRTGPVLHAQLSVAEYEEIAGHVQSYFQAHSGT
jgi:hypothetical protein